MTFDRPCDVISGWEVLRIRPGVGIACPHLGMGGAGYGGVTQAIFNRGSEYTILI